MTRPEFRVWIGWRAASFRGEGGWGRFVEALAKTFIPATWLVMPRFGLRSYVPSVTLADLPHGCPEETALLIYDTRADYERHKTTVGGRGYSQMHGAVFGFDEPRRSRSGWATAGGTDPQNPKLAAWFWDGEDPRLTLDSPAAQVAFVMAAHDPITESKDTASALYQAVGYTRGQVVLCMTPSFTLAWAAIAEPDSQTRSFAARMAASLPGAQVLSEHVAVKADATGDYLDGPDTTVSVSDQMSLRFLR